MQDLIDKQGGWTNMRFYAPAEDEQQERKVKPKANSAKWGFDKDEHKS